MDLWYPPAPLTATYRTQKEDLVGMGIDKSIHVRTNNATISDFLPAFPPAYLRDDAQKTWIKDDSLSLSLSLSSLSLFFSL